MAVSGKRQPRMPTRRLGRGVGASLEETPITLIGHPFAPIGMGEQLRSHVRALSALGLHHRVFDIFRYAERRDQAHFDVAGSLERHDLPAGIRIFHINADEVERVLSAFATRGGDFKAGTNIIVPAWELPRYPAVWAKALRRFDEVWALSHFIEASLASAGIDSHFVGQTVELGSGPLLGRRYFGIRESAFVLLHFFDLSSYASRKNPEAVLDLFSRLRREDPWRDLVLVLKVKDGERGAEDWAASLAADGQVKVLVTPLDTTGVRSLIAACDCFVSLHRAEGFGRGLGEAMALGRLALGTGWSGNLDFMSEENALLVRYELVPVASGAYPHGEGQLWAEADIDHAAALLRPLLADAERGRAIARRGQREVLLSHGNRAVGLRMLARLEAIVAAGATNAAASRAAPRRRAPKAG